MTDNNKAAKDAEILRLAADILRNNKAASVFVARQIGTARGDPRWKNERAGLALTTVAIDLLSGVAQCFDATASKGNE